MTLPTMQERIVLVKTLGYNANPQGWSVISSTVWYSRRDELVFVTFQLIGTSNATTATMSAPFANAVGTPIRFSIWTKAGTVRDWGIGVLGGSSSLITFYKDPIVSAWATSGDKDVYGQFFYTTLDR